MSDLRDKIAQVLANSGSELTMADSRALADEILAIPEIAQAQERARTAYMEGYDDEQEAHATAD